MTEPLRVSPEETRRKVLSGTALLVCAYDDDQKFKAIRLDGAIPFSELKDKAPRLPKDQEIIFYCA